jgi:hypothetical protein
VLADELPTLEDVDEIKIESVGNETGLRREWRIVANTRELRGLCWRERNANRKAVRYVGKRNSEEFERYANTFEEWRRTNRATVGIDLVTNRDVDEARIG